MDYLLGMAQLGRKFALLLDVNKVLTTEELHDLSEVSAYAENALAEELTGEGPLVLGVVEQDAGSELQAE